MAIQTLATVEDAGRKSLADIAYESVRDRLLTLDIKPGDLLNDDQLAKELGIGRTPVREALKRLELDQPGGDVPATRHFRHPGGGH